MQATPNIYGTTNFAYKIGQLCNAEKKKISAPIISYLLYNDLCLNHLKLYLLVHEDINLQTNLP